MRYDAVVIGAGPSGSMAAYEIAAAGHSVLLLEKHTKPGLPLCCAEAVSRPAFDKLIEPRANWISAFIDRIRVVGPEGSELRIHHPRAGYILDRRTFDYDLALRAVHAGCELACETIGLQLKRCGDRFGFIKVSKFSGEKAEIEASIFIAADGVESRIAGSAGLESGIPFDEAESLLQYRIEDIAVDADTIEFHLGRAIAPGGYIWVFPKSACSANVGIGMTGDSMRSDMLKKGLDAFIGRRFGGGRISEKMCGLTPKYNGQKMFRIDNLLVAGDAARALDSLSGAGIINAMISGRFAGQAAAEFLSRGSYEIARLEELYPARFLEIKGEELAIYRKLRNVYKNLDDGDFEDIIAALNSFFDKNPVYGINAGKLMVEIVRTRPRLLRLVRHLL